MQKCWWGQLTPQPHSETPNPPHRHTLFMRYIVTGGAGFIGSNLAETLAQHHDVVVIDNLATGRRENVEHLLDHPRVTFVEGSITDLDLLMETSPSADGIFHQAAIPSVPRSVIEPPRLERGERDRHARRPRRGEGLQSACRRRGVLLPDLRRYPRFRGDGRPHSTQIA